MKQKVTRFVLTLLVMMLTTATAWATTTSTINVGGTDYTLFTGFTATDGSHSNYENMVDGSTSTNYHVFASSAYVEFNADDPIVPRGYIFNTFMDGNFFPTSWVLKAKASAGDSWTPISSESGGTNSGTEFTYSCNDAGNVYKYFRFEVTRSGQGNNNNIWLTEIRLYGSAELPADYHSVTIADAMSGLISCEANKARAGSTVTLTLSHLVDESTLSVNDGAVTTTDIGNRQYTFTMPDGDVNVTATARATYSVTLPANMEIVSTTNDADGNGQYIEGTVVTFKPSFPYTASNVSDGTNTLTADGDGNYSVTVSTADITVTATVERNSNIDLSQATEGYTAINGDVLTGATSHAVAVAAGAGITLSGATISDGIVCEGSATITLVGTNNVTASDLKAGIQVGGSGTTLTIRGDGSLTATGGSQHCAGIGLKNASENDVIGGDIVIEGGNITATGGGTSGWAAGIGTGVAIDNHTAQIGNITIKGGSVTAVGGGDAAGIGTGYEWSESHTIAGTVTIYDGIDMVDASSITGDVTYMHVENDTETNVTTTASTYFNITEDGDRRIIYPRDDTDYTVTIDDNITGGTVTASPTTAKRGTIVTLTITPDAGNRLQTLTVKDANNNDVAVANNCFLMPKDGASVTGTFVQRTTSFNESTGVLTLSGNVNADEVKEYGFVLNSYGGIDEDSRVTSVVCEPGTVMPTDCSELFMTFNKVVTIDLSNAGTANITNTSRMFGSNWLTTIYVNSAWSMANVTSSDYMFYNCYRLTGGNGTEWNDVKDTIYESNGGDREAAMAAAGSGTYAVIDKEEDDEGRHEGYLTFKKGTPAIITAPTANTLTYTGEAQALVTAGTTTFGTLLYSTDGTNYSEDISTATDAGTYTVYYKVDETEDWYAVTAQTVEVTIAQKAVTNEDITVTIPSQTWTGNELTPVITVKDGENVLTENTDYTVTAPSGPIQDSGNYTYTITGMGNYAGSKEATFTITPRLARQYGAVYIYQDQNGMTALLDGTSVEPVDIDYNHNIIVNHVTSNRVFTPGMASTVMLPFNYTCNGNEGGTFYKFVGVKKENDKWVATMQETGNDTNKQGTLEANTPYLFMPAASTMTFPNINGSVRLFTRDGGSGGNCETADPGSHWTFKGTYEYMHWKNDPNDLYYYYRSQEIGHIYGFAGVSKNDINVGDFVKVAWGAKIRPMRAYLLWNDIPNSANARSFTRGAAATDEELPQRITVRLVGSNGETTGIGEIDTKTGEMTFDSEAWYTLDGVRLSGKPTKKGLYINNGKKIVIK